MKILVTGTQGYIGTVLTSELLNENFQVIGFDVGYFKNCLLTPFKENFLQINKDIREINKEDLKEVEAIVHLSGLSNDPLGEFDKKITREINFDATIRLAKLSKDIGIKRFVYASSQSMYGISDTTAELDEYNSDKKPLTEYAKTKWDAEVELNKLNSNNFTVVSFRPSTVFGASPRLRCDIVYNYFLACAYTTGKIEIKSDGSPFRPVIHVKDVCSAFIAGLKAPKKIISGKSYNIGMDNGNYTVKELAMTVKKIIPESKIIFTNEHGNDARTYKVSFKRILTELKDFYKPKWDLERGGIEMINYFKKINFNEAQFRGEITNRLNQLKRLIKKKEIDQNFRIIN